MKILKIAFFALFVLALSGCNNQKVGYLETENGVYVPNTMDIRLVLDDELDIFRIANAAPWVSPRIQGVIGTEPIQFEIVNVTSDTGDAEMFRALLSIRGGGRMVFPLVSDITPGEYRVSIRISNEDHSGVLNEVFTFVVK